MKVDSTTNKFPYSAIMDADDDLLSMAGMGLGHGGDDSSQHSGHRTEMRKSNKPIMEKRRRARINNCLNELKNILLEAMKKDPARHSKLEKADILELTVRHLQNIQRNQLAIAMATDPTVLHRFKNGFSECVSEVNRYMGRVDGADQGVRQRLLDHLGNCVNGLQQVGPAPFGSTGPVSAAAAYPGAVVGAPPPPPASFPGATMPPATALGIHSAAAAIANLRHASSATHIPPSAGAVQPNFSADDLNNNFVRAAAAGPPPQHPHDTSARLMSAFAVASTLPRPLRPPSPPASPPPSLNMSSSSHESSSTPSSLFQQSTPSSRNDSGLSDHSDLGSSSASRSSSSSNRTSGTGDPIDFSIGKVLDGQQDSISRTSGASNNSTPVRVVKVEPMPSIPTPSPDDSSMPPNKDMWRPW